MARSAASPVTARKADGEPDRVLPSSVPLGPLAAKYTIPSLAAFLENPVHSRPSGRMPRLLNAKEAKDVANYLLQGVKLPGGGGGRGSTRFAYYEGDFGDQLPDFARLKPQATGVGPAFDLGRSPRRPLCSAVRGGGDAAALMASITLLSPVTMGRGSPSTAGRW
ncbi:MAG: hypothetical protein U0736_12095 [Gemmataceae bacterium]